YKEVQERGQIEVTVSPFYHPILPLVYNLKIAAKSSPGIRFPPNEIHYPEDGETQLTKAINYYEKIFNQKP
ncbi:MAG TPA: glycoside hydrolase, partial [Elusimicrobia bacterium]|nr:glycoside hydrolase [Elusimicrobiota bacterium]